MQIFIPSESILAGVDQATLQQWLTDAQAALQALMIGGRPVSLSYDGKSVTYTQADRGELGNWIYLLQRQLGLVHGRRALVPIFN
jgi:hypothetical protein